MEKEIKGHAKGYDERKGDMEGKYHSPSRSNNKMLLYLR
jgi:hypothetical protein